MGMAEGCDLGCDAALFIGYHKRKGGKGVASHSLSLIHIWLRRAFLYVARLADEPVLPTTRARIRPMRKTTVVGYSGLVRILL